MCCLSTVNTGDEFSGIHFHRDFMYVFLFCAALGLHCCTQAFSACSEQRLLSMAVCGLLTVLAFPVAEPGLLACKFQ